MRNSIRVCSILLLRSDGLFVLCRARDATSCFWTINDCIWWSIPSDQAMFVVDHLGREWPQREMMPWWMIFTGSMAKIDQWSNWVNDNCIESIQDVFFRLTTIVLLFFYVLILCCEKILFLVDVKTFEECVDFTVINFGRFLTCGG